MPSVVPNSSQRVEGENALRQQSFYPLKKSRIFCHKKAPCCCNLRKCSISAIALGGVACDWDFWSKPKDNFNYMLCLRLLGCHKLNACNTKSLGNANFHSCLCASVQVRVWFEPIISGIAEELTLSECGIVLKIPPLRSNLC